MATVPARRDQRGRHGGRPSGSDHADHLGHRRCGLGGAESRNVGIVATRSRRRPSSPRASRSSCSNSAVVGRTNGRPGRHRGRPSRHWRWSRSTACAMLPTTPTLHGSSRSAPNSAPPTSAELLSTVDADPATHGQLAAAIGCSAAWLPGRERTKTNNIRVIHEMRMAMRELGRRMVDRGAFDEVEDFGFVREAEMPTLLADPHSLTESSQPPRRVPHLQELEPPFVFVGHTGGPDTWPRRDAVGCRSVVGRRHRDRPPGLPWDRRRHRLASCSTPTTLGAAAGRCADRADHRSFVDAAVRAGSGGGRRCRCGTEPRDHRQPRARDSVRGLGRSERPATSPMVPGYASTATPAWSPILSVP